MTSLRARVLLDTGPSPDELVHISRLFENVGLTAEAEGHSYGGPPPTSMFLIVVNVPLAAFLDVFAARPAGPADLESLLRGLLAIRADSGRWGRSHVLKLEDAHSDVSTLCGPDLPSRAYSALLALDLAAFDQATPAITLCWQASFERWCARMDAGPRQVIRRPTLRDGTTPRERGARQLATAELAALWQVVESAATPVITWQRAQVVLLSGMGWSLSSIAARTLISRSRVKAIISAFNHDGFAALASAYEGGGPWRPPAEAEREARAIAALGPRELGLEPQEWDVSLLGEFLVGSGVVEDATADWLAGLLRTAQATPRISQEPVGGG